MLLSVTQKLGQAQPASSAPISQATQEGSGFADVLRAQQSTPSSTAREPVQVQRGDTLIGLVKQNAARSGITLSEGEAMRQALRTAKINGISNPNLILPGQNVDFSTLTARFEARAEKQQTIQPSTQDALLARQAAQGETILNKTLDRAVDKGYISRAEQPLVQERILKLARDFNFDPDDFAHVAMMESDGLNPRATNGQCHGIIQFCEGPGRGAASVNKQGQASSIRSMSVLQQLDLVEKYFRDVGLDGSDQKLKLDDLYLSVLTPAARAYREPNQALPIAGTQAAALHINGQRSRPITRNSIVQGLVQNSLDRLVADRTGFDVSRKQAQFNQVGTTEEILTGDYSMAAKRRQNIAVQDAQTSNANTNLPVKPLPARES
jgi:hypothetical protein